MTDTILEKLRMRLPLKAQIGYGWLKYNFKPHPQWNDPEFTSYCRWLEKTQWLTRDMQNGLQLERLQALVKHAYENVPYYRRVFDEYRVKPNDIVTQDDLQKFPLLTKEDVRNNLEDLVARNINRSSLILRTTSGSTGIPLGVYQDIHTSWLHELALESRQMSWAGCRFGERFVTLRGNVLPANNSQGRKTWWSYYPGHNQLILSAFDMTEENLFRYIQKISDFQPKFIQAYPSAIEILARFMNRNTININNPITAIFCGSETLYPQQRKVIESQFGCRIFDRYAMTEKVVDAVECETHQGYHVSMEYGVLELIDRFDEPIRRSGIPGRVVGTGFDTMCMPLIRYVTDDIAEYATSSCTCERQSTLIKDFKGRLCELVFSKNGQIVPLAPVYASIHGLIIAKIREIKFLQEREGELIIQIVKAPTFSEAEVAKGFLNELYDRIDEEEFSIQIIFVDCISRTGRGKLGLLDQRLPIKAEYLDHFRNETGVTGIGSSQKFN